MALGLGLAIQTYHVSNPPQLLLMQQRPENAESFIRDADTDDYWWDLLWLGQL
jgi:hypothetical protein